MGLYVLTGGPYGGKTSVIRRLNSMGYQTRPEAARLVFDQIASEGHERSDYSDLQGMIESRNIQMESDLPTGDVFLDRSLADNLAYRRHYGTTDFDAQLQDKWNWTEGAYDGVFLFPPLPGITDERQEDEQEAWEIYDQIVEAYAELGYDPTTVPDMTVRERADYILAAIQ